MSNQMLPYPRLKGQVDSVPPLVYSYPPLPGVGEGHLRGVQLKVLISRCQGVEHDLAHQLVGTRADKGVSVSLSTGSQPQKQDTVRPGEGGRKEGKLSHTPPPTCSSPPPPHTPGGSHFRQKEIHTISLERKSSLRGKEKSDHKDVLKRFPNSRGRQS